MKIKHERSLLHPEINDKIANKIECCSWSPNATRLAICTSTNNQVILFNGHTFEKKEKFALKATAKNFSRKSFAVKGLAFSPDSLKLAVGQTDCVIFVYKIGDNWGDKKTIIGKYTLQSPLTCLFWHDSGIIFGSADGKVKLINTTANRMTNLISTNSMAISLSVAGDTLAAGFLNGSVMFATLGGRENCKQLATTTSPPFALALTYSGYVCFGGCDGRITFVNSNQEIRGNRQIIELGTDIGFATSSPSGNIVVVSSGDKVYVFGLEGQFWRQTQLVELSGSFLVTGLFWSKDGTKLVVGTVNGAIELFSFQWKRKLIGENHEVNYVGTNQVVIKDVANHHTAVFRSKSEVKDVKMSGQHFAIIWTVSSLMVGDIRASDTKTSEIDWTGMTQEGVKFCFDYDGVVLVYVVGELHLVELGSDQLLASVRTDFVNPHLMSVRVNERKSGVKVLAYLLDLKTISVTDLTSLTSSVQLCVWSHEERVDWLELNETGKRLLFRDRSCKLYMLDICTQDETVLMLNICGFVQWVPNSDVIVAQSSDKLYVWYDLSKPVIHEISGGSRLDATGIEREGGLSRVTFSGGSSNDIVLDEVLLEFDTALQDQDLERAMSFLESCDFSAECESMWRTLGAVALKKRDLVIAERSFAAVGDVTRAAFVRDCVQDESKLALLEADWSTFECGDLDTVVETYIQLHKWDKAIDLATRSGRNDVREDLERRYYDHLLATNQEAEAGLVMQKSGQLDLAIKLFLKSGRAIEAANVILDSSASSLPFTQSLIESIISQLVSSEHFQVAGKVYEKVAAVRDFSKALENYVKGHDYGNAIELARREFQDQVVQLELQFGEYLLTQVGDAASAISHLIEAGNNGRALDAAIQAGQFERAAEICAILDTVPQHLGRQIGDYYATKDRVDEAVEIYLISGCVRDALTLLNNRGHYSRAFKLAKKLMAVDEAKEMYASIATALQDEGKLKEAEKVFMTCEDVDSAISMYKSARQYDQMMRLVKLHHPDLLNDTHVHLAKELEVEGQLLQAESHFVAAGDWQAALEMYKNQGKWEETYRVARSHGGSLAAKQVAYLWAKSVAHNSIDEAVKLLTRFALLHQVVDYAVELKSFQLAKDLVANSGSDMKHKLAEVKVKYAMALEDEGRLEEAELEFVEAGKAKEAVLMYLHGGAFNDAIRVAQLHVKDDNCVSDVLVAQAKSILENGRGGENMARAESLLLRAARSELAVKMYKDAKMWEDAARVCEQYAPHLLESLKREMAIMSSRGSDTSAFDGFSRASSRGSTGHGMRQMDRSTRDGREEDEQDDGDGDGDSGDLGRALSRAQTSGDREKTVKLALLVATQMLKEKSYSEALRTLLAHPGTFLMADSKKVVLRAAMDMFSFDSTQKLDVTAWKSVRDALYQVSLSSSTMTGSEIEKVDKALLVSHYLMLQHILADLKGQSGAKDLEVKLSVSLLRYTQLVRVEKMFYEAGRLAKEGDKLQMAFVFWNHFLDLVEAIEEGDVNVDHSDFVGTDIPFEVPLPSQPFFESSQTIVEDVKSWILEISMDAQVSQELPLCPFREGDVYEASLINKDMSVLLPCIVTGYPVIKHKMLELKQGKLAANKDDWNKLLMLAKVSASDDLKEVILFIGKMCGNATVARFSFQ